MSPISVRPRRRIWLSQPLAPRGQRHLALRAPTHRPRPALARPFRLTLRPLRAQRAASHLVLLRPKFSVGYNLPATQRKRSVSWGYTQPTHTRGAFIRLVGGIFGRRGRSRRCLRALHQFCSDPTLVTLQTTPTGAPTAAPHPQRARLRGARHRGSYVRRCRPAALTRVGPTPNLRATAYPTPLPHVAPTAALPQPSHLNM